MKHWIYPNDIVQSSLLGLAQSNPAVNLIPSEKIIFNPNSDTSKKVTLISGGGAGHEPLHGGFVGENLLDAAVSGAIFALPSTRQILAAIHTKSDKNCGTLIIVKNYTGDILHFGLAVERAKAEGYVIDMLVVGDDVAVGREQNKMVGRRGLAGTALVHKILGAFAAEDRELEELSVFGEELVSGLVTMSALLDRTSVPGRNEEDDSEDLSHDHAELGLGIHNEPGTAIPIPSIDKLVDSMYEKLLGDDPERLYAKFDEDDDYIILVNNIGGTSLLEMYAITSYVVSQCPLKKEPKRVYVLDFVTSLNAPGFSITLLNLDRASHDILPYLDTPTNAPGWKIKEFVETTQDLNVESPYKAEVVVESNLRTENLEQGIRGSIKRLLEEEPKITKYDTLVGDGDCGETLVAGANSILKALDDPEFRRTLNDPVATVNRIMTLVDDSMGGTSGGIYSIFLTSFGHYLNEKNTFDVESVADSLQSALYDGLFNYTKARSGGRTLIDTLQPFVDTLVETKSWEKALNSAKDGCEGTRKLAAQFGRASYVDEEQFHDEDGGNIPDPGAVGLLAIIEGWYNQD